MLCSKFTNDILYISENNLIPIDVIQSGVWEIHIFKKAGEMPN